MLNNDDLLDKFQDDPTTIATMGIIPLEFTDQASESWYLEDDLMVEEAECATLVWKELEEIRFKKWTKARHLRPLYIKAHINGKPISRVLINGEAMLNMMSYSIVKRLGKSCKDFK